MLRVEDPEPVTVAGVKLVFEPLGAPLALSVTVPLKPFCGVTVNEAVAVPPGLVANEAEGPVIVKLGADDPPTTLKPSTAIVALEGKAPG